MYKALLLRRPYSRRFRRISYIAHFRPIFTARWRNTK